MYFEPYKKNWIRLASKGCKLMKFSTVYFFFIYSSMPTMPSYTLSSNNIQANPACLQSSNASSYSCMIPGTIINHSVHWTDHQSDEIQFILSINSLLFRSCLSLNVKKKTWYLSFSFLCRIRTTKLRSIISQ